MQTMLDPRSRPTTEEERAKTYKLINPVADEFFTLCTQPGSCFFCEKRIELLSPVWLHDVGLSDGPEPTYALACMRCTRSKLGNAVREYANEQEQRRREERLEQACAAEARGQMSTADWFAIAEANLGYVEPPDLPAAVGELADDYANRFAKLCTPEHVERVRAKLYALAPQPRLKLVIDDEIAVEHLEAGRARFSFCAQVVVR